MICETENMRSCPSKGVVQDVGVHLDHGGGILLGLVRFGARRQEDVVDNMSAGLAGLGWVSRWQTAR